MDGAPANQARNCLIWRSQSGHVPDLATLDKSRRDLFRDYLDPAALQIEFDSRVDLLGAHLAAGLP